MKIVIVGSGGYNKGSLSVIKSTIKMLKEEASDVKISILSHFPEIDSYQCEATAFKYPTFQPGLFAKLKGIPPFVQCILLAILYRLQVVDVKWLVEVDRLGLLQAYLEADCILICGTDDISDMYGFLSFMTLYEGVFIATLMKKPVIINATQISPFQKSLRGKICIFLSQLILNRVNLITARDQISKDFLHKMNVNTPLIYLTADPSFILQPAPCKEESRY